jgi:hypothetical protein
MSYKNKIIAAVFLLACASTCAGQDAIVNNNLEFGDMLPGIPKVVSKYDAGQAAEFAVTGTANAEVAIDFTLPTYMSSSGYNMQLIFSETDCAMDSSSTPDQTNPGYDNLDPWHTITYRLGANGLMIWLGGQAVPKIRQHQGSYSASIVITIAYTGN